MWWSVVITICETNSAFTKSSSTGTTCRFDGTGFSINIFLLMSIRNIIFKMKVCIICHARWEIPFEFFSLRNYFELLIYCFIFWFSIWAGWWTGQKRWGWGRQPFPFSCLDLDFFCLFLLEHFTFFRLDEGEFTFLFLDLCH